MNTTTLYTELLKAISEFYPNDHICPGLVVSWLPEERLFYASICRYPASHTDKVIVTSTTDDTVEATIVKLAKLWRKKTTHVKRLDNILKRLYTNAHGDLYANSCCD